MAQILIFTILVCYTFGGLVLCNLLYDIQHCNSYYYWPYYNATDWKDAIAERSYETRHCAGGHHGIYSMMGAFIVGYSVLVFRFCGCLKSRMVKYIHLGIHLAAIFFFGKGIRAVYIHESTIQHYGAFMHVAMSYALLGFYFIQVVFSIIIFVYAYRNDWLRLGATHFHNVLGTWLFICVVASCQSGKRWQRIDYLPENSHSFVYLCHLCFIPIVLIIVSPAFEWELNGPL